MLNKIRTLIIVAVLALFATQVAANNQVLAPDDNCPDNLTLLPANTDVYFAPYIQQGQVSNGFVEQVVLNNLHSFVMNYLQSELPVSSLLTAPPELDEIGEAPTPIVLTGNYLCYSDGFTAILRETQANSWIIEKIVFEEVVLTDDIIDQFTMEVLDQLELAPENNSQLNVAPAPSVLNLGVQAPDSTPVLHNARFNFWQVYNVTVFDTPDTLAAPESLPNNYCGDYFEPSYLAVGMQAEMTGYQYARFPNSGDLSGSDWHDLSEPTFASPYSMNFFTEMRQLPIFMQPFDDFSNIFYVAPAGTIFAPPVIGPYATVIDGPICGEQIVNGICDYEDICEATDLANQFVTWWEIEVTVHGETYQGWYPENVTRYAYWLYEYEGIFDQAATSYLLVPYGQAMTVSGDDCDELPGSRFAAGMDVQPATGAMNIRDDANGSVIGRVEIDDVMTLVGEPECEDGVRWREAIFHSGSVPRGWIAENDATTWYIAPYVPPVETPEPEPTRPATAEQPSSSNSNNDDRQPSTPRPTPQPTRDPGRTTCDPATGRGC